MLYRDVEANGLLARERVGELTGEWGRRTAARDASLDAGLAARRLGIPPELVRRLRAGGFLERLAAPHDELRRRLFAAMWLYARTRR